MKIAMVSPLAESVPPKLYGGTERVVSFLTEELVRAGHQVTLFASGDSQTSAQLYPVVPEALRLGRCKDPLAHHVRMVECVVKNIDDFDIIHFHADYLHYPVMRLLGYPHVTTLHGRLDLPDLQPLYQEFDDVPVISISNAQRAPLSFVNWQATVYNGIPKDLFRLHREPGEYLAFLGRISPEKRLDRAIQIAIQTDTPLKIAAKVDDNDREYYETLIRPLLNHPLVEYVGEIGDHEKEAFLGNAKGLLFPIDWPEPFGLVMIESMACGTPVIAWSCGSVPEIMRQEVTGFIVDDMDSAAAAVKRLDTLDRAACRRHFEGHFTATKMALSYVDVYRNNVQKTAGLRPRRAL